MQYGQYSVANSGGSWCACILAAKVTRIKQLLVGNVCAARKGTRVTMTCSRSRQKDFLRQVMEHNRGQ